MRLQEFARAAFLSDNRADVTYLSTRTLVVQCTHDVASPPEVGDYLLRHLPQAERVTLQTSGHCRHLSAPMETLTAIDYFLAH
ncbi:alpha/beta fold hydrolase [Hymenobacter sediminis]|uniref:alpha/beta fold hydrolase n=1 Tax=Hymenobacter sediminis TaxID=2218621 RepID=UPI0013905B1D|nr:alpha/beta hydrolase [Hymenobacter sediminis]